MSEPGSPPGTPGRRPGRTAGSGLLPYFDPYVVAGQPRERLYSGAAAARALTPSGQAGNYPVLFVDDEAALVGTVMEATVTLTVGPVTVGPHA